MAIGKHFVASAEHFMAIGKHFMAIKGAPMAIGKHFMAIGKARMATAEHFMASADFRMASAEALMGMMTASNGRRFRADGPSSCVLNKPKFAPFHLEALIDVASRTSGRGRLKGSNPGNHPWQNGSYERDFDVLTVLGKNRVDRDVHVTGTEHVTSDVPTFTAIVGTKYDIIMYPRVGPRLEIVSCIRNTDNIGDPAFEQRSIQHAALERIGQAFGELVL